VPATDVTTSDIDGSTDVRSGRVPADVTTTDTDRSTDDRPASSDL
jgi:hypothetical protein